MTQRVHPATISRVIHLVDMHQFVKLNFNNVINVLQENNEYDIDSSALW